MDGAILPNMAHADLVLALKQRRSELTQEITHIDGLLALHGESPNGSVTGEQPVTASNRGGLFVANPNSKTSRVLKATREMLEAAPGRELPFLTILHRLPKELVGTSRHRREHIRGIIQKGEREGIEYVDAQHVRLVAK